MRKRNNILWLITILMIWLAFSSVSWGKAPEGLVFFFAFDEKSGDTVRDQSGFGNNGIITGKQDWINGKFKGGFHFDGKTNISVKNAEPLTSLTHPMSVAAWVNPDSITGWHNIIEMDRTAASKVNGWKLGFNATKTITWTTYGVLDFSSVTVIDFSKWTHVAATWDGARAIVYVNGKPDPPMSGGGVINVKDTNDIPSLDLGWRRSSASSYYQGGMDEVCIFKRVLSENEINSLMNGLGDMMAVDPGGKLSTVWGDVKVAK
ncbi:MAG: LamG domain-containing protein [Candidatus Poribacteria bacterium]